MKMDDLGGKPLNPLFSETSNIVKTGVLVFFGDSTKGKLVVWIGGMGFKGCH